jgi:hypothetical protein
MLEFGCTTKWSPHACRMKWAELHPESATQPTSSTPTSAVSNNLQLQPGMDRRATEPHVGQQGAQRAYHTYHDVNEHGEGADDEAEGGQRNGRGTEAEQERLWRRELGQQHSQPQQQQEQRQVPARSNSEGGLGAPGQPPRVMYEQRQDWVVRPQ